MKSLEETLGQFDRPLSSLVKVNVNLSRIEDLSEMEKAFRAYFESDGFPARMTSTSTFFDDDGLLMIDGIVYAGDD